MEGQVWLTPDLVRSSQTPVLSAGNSTWEFLVEMQCFWGPPLNPLSTTPSRGPWNLYGEHVREPHQCASRNLTLENHPRPSNEYGELTALAIELEMIDRD